MQYYIEITKEHMTWEDLLVIRTFCERYSKSLDILHGIRNQIVTDSGAEHFNSIMVF